jgi:multidrug efflux pump subunit AcrA (membrane-fusion protein)
MFIVEDQGGKQLGRLRTVTLGEAFGNKVAVKSGVKLGEQVITSGLSRLVDGESVQVIP